MISWRWCARHSLLIATALFATSPRIGAVASCEPAAAVISGATAAERAEFDAGVPIMRTINVEGRHWPRVCAYQPVDASPAEVMAVLTDFRLQATFVPHVESSEIVSKADSTAGWRVAYRLNLGLGMHEVDTLAEALVQERTGEDDAYRVTWRRLASTRAELIEGNAFVSRYRTSDRTISVMVYEQNVEPSNGLIKRLFKRKAIGAVREITMAVARRTESERSHDPDLLRRQIDEMHRVLSLAR